MDGALGYVSPGRGSEDPLDFAHQFRGYRHVADGDGVDDLDARVEEGFCEV